VHDSFGLCGRRRTRGPDCRTYECERALSSPDGNLCSIVSLLRDSCSELSYSSSCFTLTPCRPQSYKDGSECMARHNTNIVYSYNGSYSKPHYSPRPLCQRWLSALFEIQTFICMLVFHSVLNFRPIHFILGPVACYPSHGPFWPTILLPWGARLPSQCAENYSSGI
jgi:hypothetical protein